MTWEYLHLIVHQFPIVLAVAGTAVGLAGWAAGRPELERFGALSLLLAGVAAIPSYYTGLAAADTVVRRTFVTPDAVEHHRTWATWAAVVLVSAGIFAGFSLWQTEDERLRRFVLLTGVAASALTGYAAWLGGGIVHGSAPEPEADSEDRSHGTVPAGGTADGGPDRLDAATPHEPTQPTPDRGDDHAVLR